MGGADYDTRLDEQLLRNRIIAALHCVKGLFDDERELKKRFGLKVLSGSFSSPSNLLTMPGSSSTAAQPPLPRKREPVFFWKKQQRSASRLRDQAAWAISDRDNFSELGQHLKEFNDDLGAMTQPLTGVMAKQRRIVLMEIDEIQDMATLNEIAEAARDDNDLISYVVSVRIESIRSGASSSRGRTGANDTAKSFRTALTSIPNTIDEKWRAIRLNSKRH